MVFCGCCWFISYVLLGVTITPTYLPADNTAYFAGKDDNLMIG
jgi:hypothetical protein